ncbi:MAG: trehalose-6-phosphate synthase [Anaerolineae bacterium]|nr:trehalose-6-phosphate synthase [Anaerolineae bacterium]
MSGETTAKEPLIVIASNRGPYAFKLNEETKELVATRGAGGLVTALSAIGGEYDVLWVAAALGKGDVEWVRRHKGQPQIVDNMRISMIIPDRRRYGLYYNTISNPLLWFIQHELWDTPRQPSITASTWDAWREGYVAINQQFAEAIVSAIGDTDRPVLVFPQDYHLYLVPHFVREKLAERVQIQPFLHIPWPGPDAWRILPEHMRTELLTSMLNSDRIGFQTKTDAFNFVQACRFYLPDAHSYGSRDTIEYKGRTVQAVAYPISIDVERVEELAAAPSTRLIREQLLSSIGDYRMVLRVDRIEPSKNIVRGLEAFRALLQAHPEHRGKVKMLALLVPSRMDVEEYRAYLGRIMTEAGRINAEFSDAFYEPVRIILGQNYERALAAMQFYDVLLVNPLTDGMNLVAKEGALVNQRDGVLVLSEFAGAIYELGDHVLKISPFDVYGTAEAIHQALTMPYEERTQRATALREIVQRAGVKEWFSRQVNDALVAIKKVRETKAAT